LIYYLDGYNYLFTRGKKEDPLQSSREEILEEFSCRVKDLSLVIVFDAQHDPSEFSRTYYKNIEVVYSSHNQTADDFIIERITHSKTPYNITVISDDKKLLKEVRELKGCTYSFEKFLKRLNKNKNDLDDKSNAKKFGSQESDYYIKKFNQ